MTTPTTSSVVTPLGRVSFQETGLGRPILLIHSLLTDRRAFDRVTPLLPGRLIAVDLPGFGETTPAAPEIEAFADLIAAGLAQISPDETATVIGNGLGSFVALGLAIRRPDLVDRLVLVGAGATFPVDARPVFSNMIGMVESGGIGAVTPVALRRIFTEPYLETHPEAAEERAGVLAETDPAAFVTACKALGVVDFTGTAATVAAPTLIVVGEADQATTPAMAAGLQAIIPDSRMVILPGIAHAPQLQDPEGFIEVITSFLEGE
ncbi:MAG TPA: alpha/beta hydrolase [Acidimicrobiia bacterium]